MNIGTHSFLCLIACVIFGIGFGVIVFSDPPAKFFAEDILLGLSVFAAGHVLP